MKTEAHKTKSIRNTICYNVKRPQYFSSCRPTNRSLGIVDANFSCVFAAIYLHSSLAVINIQHGRVFCAAASLNQRRIGTALCFRVFRQ